MRCPHCGEINYGDVKTCFKCSENMFQQPQVSEPSREHYQKTHSGAHPYHYYQHLQPQKTPPIKKQKAGRKVILLYTIGIILIVLGIIFLVFMQISIQNSTKSDSTTISPLEPIDIGKECDEGDTITVEFKADSPVNVIIIQKSEPLDPHIVSKNKTKDKVEFEVPESDEWGVLIGSSQQTKIDYSIYYQSQALTTNCSIPDIIFMIIGIVLIILGVKIRRKNKRKMTEDIKILPPT